MERKRVWKQLLYKNTKVFKVIKGKGKRTRLQRRRVDDLRFNLSYWLTNI